MTTLDDGIQAGKADFGAIYDRRDPRAYYATLSELDYEIPAHGAEVFSHLARTRAEADGGGGDTVVLDVCCSYGAVPALMNHDLTIDDLYEHYQRCAAADLSRAEQLAADQRLFADRRVGVANTVMGLDAAANAVDYAVEAGILDRGHAADLETEEAGPDLAADLADVDLITITGGIGYVGAATFDRLLDAADDEQPPWVAAMSLRWIDFAPIAEVFDDHGLVTERVVDPSFRQRRFADGEQAVALDNLADLGLDPAGKEAEGWHYADLYLARSGDDVEAVPAEVALGLDGTAGLEVERLT
jgi:hypothetical protein